MTARPLKIFCPAKINLFLEVTGKRPDGYHELATIFAKLDFGDYINLAVLPSDKTEITLKTTGPYAAVITADENNLVHKAARGFMDFAGKTARLEITLEKNIPTGAGLGGGSSDAGRLLRALCGIYKIDFKTLIPLAAALGADVPLFLYDEPFLKAAGIGEILEPFKAKAPLPYVVLGYPDELIPTKDIFARFKLASEGERLTKTSCLDKIIVALSEGKPPSCYKDLLFNRLEDFVLPYHGKVRELKSFMQAGGADACMMSGSGSTVFALTEKEETAKKLAARVKQRGNAAFTARFPEG